MDGECTILISPWSAISSKYLTTTTTSDYLPYITQNNASPDFPYKDGATYYDGPFSSQLAVISTYAIDVVSVEFQCTMSPLDVSGRF